MTENPEISEETARSGGAEDEVADGDAEGGAREGGAPEGTSGPDASEQPPPPAGPRGADGESRVVAERSGSDTTFPARPLLADPDDARRVPGEDGPEIEDASEHASAGRESGETDGEKGGAAGEGGEDGTETAPEGAGDAGDAGSTDGRAEPEVGPAS